MTVTKAERDGLTLETMVWDGLAEPVHGQDDYVFLPAIDCHVDYESGVPFEQWRQLEVDEYLVSVRKGWREGKEGK